MLIFYTVLICYGEQGEFGEQTRAYLVSNLFRLSHDLQIQYHTYSITPEQKK